jgi:hypothetical protein
MLLLIAEEISCHSVVSSVEVKRLKNRAVRESRQCKVFAANADVWNWRHSAIG